MFFRTIQTRRKRNSGCWFVLVMTIIVGPWKTIYGFSLCATQRESKHQSCPKKFWLWITGRIFSEGNSSISSGRLGACFMDWSNTCRCCATKGKNQYRSWRKSFLTQTAGKTVRTRDYCLRIVFCGLTNFIFLLNQDFFTILYYCNFMLLLFP